jgi:hypothetical protein
MILAEPDLHKAMNPDLPNNWHLITSQLGHYHYHYHAPPALTRSARPARLGGRCNQV